MTANLHIIHWPHVALRTAIVRGSPSPGQGFLQEMAGVMFSLKGIGLAANQVGGLYDAFIISPEIENLGLLAWEGPRETIAGAWTFLYPRLEILDPTLEIDVEGCLSFPDIFLKVPRPRKVKLEAICGKTLKEFTVTAEGYFGRALQHEVEHLHGNNFLQYIENDVKKSIVIKKLKKTKKLSDKFKKIR